VPPCRQVPSDAGFLTTTVVSRAESINLDSPSQRVDAPSEDCVDIKLLAARVVDVIKRFARQVGN